MTRVIEKVRELDDLPVLPKDHAIYAPPDQWPEHVKVTTQADMEAAALLPVAHAECRVFWIRTERWRLGLPLQNCATSRTIKSSKLSDKAIEARVAMGQYLETDWTSMPKGCHGVNAFFANEMKVDPIDPKIRKRIVEESHLNDCVSADPKQAEALGTEAIPNVRYRTRHEIRTTLKGCQYMLQIDFDAYYPSLPIGADAMRLQIVLHKGKYYAMGVLATGARWSVCIGQALTWMIVDIDLDDYPHTGIITIIDNILIHSSDLTEFLAVVRKITDRIGAVKLQSTPPVAILAKMSDSDLAKKAMEVQVFAGEEYTWDPVSNTRLIRNSTKTAAKLLVAFDQITSPNITRRKFAALTSLIQYAMHTIAVRPSAYWRFFSAHRAICSEATQTHAGWDAPITYIADSVLEQIRELVKKCASRSFLQIPQARPLPTYDDQQYDIIVWTDASKLGWASIWHFQISGKIFIMQRPWTDQLATAASSEEEHRFRNGMSAHSEPACIFHSIKSALRLHPEWFDLRPRGERLRIAMVTDHYPIPQAQRKPSGYAGIGRGRYLNDLYVVTDQMEEKFLWLIDYFYVQGKLNPADPYSRYFEKQIGKDVRIWQHTTISLPSLSATFCPILKDDLREVWMR